MRAKEFIVEYKTQTKIVEYNGLVLKIVKEKYELKVYALDEWRNNVLGYVYFDIGDGKELDPQELYVEEKYQRQGIAKTMYDYVKKLGYTIVRSWDQTDAGAAFWDKHRGEDVRVWEGRENYNGINMLLQSDEDEVFVKASAGSRELGHVLFVIDGEYLLPQDLEVEPQYRGYNIARKMYDFVKSKGYKIRRSGNQTADGSRFWDKNRPEQNVWESSNELVPANQMYASVQKIHRALDDFSEGDLGDRIYWFDDYKLVNLPISKLNLDEHWVDEDYVEDYMNHIADSKHTMPPIVFDPIAGSIIDGTHRANAYARLGNKTIPAYVGNTKSEYYGQRDSD